MTEFGRDPRFSRLKDESSPLRKDFSQPYYIVPFKSEFSNSIARSLSDMALSSWADVVERVNGSFGVDLQPDAQPIQLGQLPPWAAYQKS